MKRFFFTPFQSDPGVPTKVFQIGQTILENKKASMLPTKLNKSKTG